MVRQWLDERRIGPDYLVWREGWPEWKRASAVFVKLAAIGPAVPGTPTAPAPTEPGPPMDDDWVDAIIESQPMSLHRPKPKPRPDNNLRLIIGVVLILVCIVLAIVLYLIVQNQRSSESAVRDSPAVANCLELTELKRPEIGGIA
jgi:hypothetical protein